LFCVVPGFFSPAVPGLLTDSLWPIPDLFSRLVLL
jgi:hypothetical protein